MVLETHMKLCMTESDFPEKNFLPPKLGKWTKNIPKTGFFEFIEKCYRLLLNLFYNENILFAVFLHKSYIWEIFIPEIWAKMFSANQIPRFFNQPYLQNKSVK